MHPDDPPRSVLLGEQPAALTVELTQAGTIPAVPGLDPRWRTDRIASPAARHSPGRARAGLARRIGAATADLYPKFQLIGTFGFDASEFKHVRLGQPVLVDRPEHHLADFQRRALAPGIRTYNEAHGSRLTTYEQAVLQAMEDVGAFGRLARADASPGGQ